MFAQTLCSLLRVEIPKPVFLKVLTTLSYLSHLFSQAAFSSQFAIISELDVLMSYCTKLVISPKT